VERSNPLVYLFDHFFEEANLVDLEPIDLVPTWCNARRGRAGILKRLDMFLVIDRILDMNAKFKSCAGQGGASNHLLVFLQVEGEDIKTLTPFKFNHH